MSAVRAISATLSRLAPGRWLAAGTRSLQVAPAAPVRHRALSFGSAITKLERESEYDRCGVEPHLEEVLRDPIVQSLMRADHIAPEEVRRTLDARPGTVAPLPWEGVER